MSSHCYRFLEKKAKCSIIYVLKGTYLKFKIFVVFASLAPLDHVKLNKKEVENEKKSKNEMISIKPAKTNPQNRKSFYFI